MSCALSILLLAAATATERVLMYRPSMALNTTSAQHIAPTPSFLTLALLSVTTNIPLPPTHSDLSVQHMREAAVSCKNGTALQQSRLVFLIHFPVAGVWR